MRLLALPLIAVLAACGQPETVERPIYPGGDCPEEGDDLSVECMGNIEVYWDAYQPEIMEQYREKNP